MNTIYIISKYLTIIGSVLKGFWEHLFCRIIGIPVSDARYLQATELCGHVEHDFTKKKLQAFLICVLPGIMNVLFGLGMLVGGYLGLFYLRPQVSEAIFWIYAVMLYLGISLMCNIAPLYEDALNNWDLLYGKNSKANIVAKIFAFIPSVLALVTAWLEKNAISVLLYIIAVVLGIVLL